MEILSSILAAKEAAGIFLEAVSFFGERSKTRVDEEGFVVLLEEAFKNVSGHLIGLGLKPADFSPAQKKDYLRGAEQHFNKRNGFYHYHKGELEKYFLDAFTLPTDNRFDVFAKYLFFLRNGLKRPFRFTLLRERGLRLIRSKNTVFHYMAIEGWINLKYRQLISEVAKVEHPKSPKPSDTISYRASKDSNEKDLPNVSKAIDVVIESGKISERAILNLASTERILIVHKYGEGFGDVYKPQQLKLAEINDEIRLLETSDRPTKHEDIRTKKREKKDLIQNWVRAPIGATLEEIGFQKLFNKMDGVYVYPVFMLPEKYHEKPTTYIAQYVIPRAAKLLKKMKSQKALAKAQSGGLKFVIMAHVVSLEKMIFLTQERELGISSPMMYRLLFKGFVFGNNSTMGSIYINDIIRNVDILSLWGGDSKSAKYLRHHFEAIKKYLWDKHQIEIYKPINLITLSNQNIQELCAHLHSIDKSLAIHHISNYFLKTVEFYRQLNEELNSMTSR